MERAIFKDRDPQEKENRRKSMAQMLSSPLSSQPEDVAKAIWNAVKHSQAEVVVGSAKVPAFLNRLFPGITQGMMQLTTKSNLI